MHVSSRPKVADLMGTRSGKQCRERYVNQLDPLIKKSVWTHEEDAVIKKIHHQVGKKWCRFMDQLPGRSDNAIKNRYHIISKNNYAEHNRVSLRKAFEAARAAPAVSEENALIVFAPESNQVKLKRFRAARILLDEKIKNLLLEQNDPCAECEEREKKLAEKIGSNDDYASGIFRQYSNAATEAFDFDLFFDLGDRWEETALAPASAAATVTVLPNSALPKRHAAVGQEGYSKYLGFPAAPADSYGSNPFSFQ